MRCLCGESFSFVSLFFCCAQKNALLFNYFISTKILRTFLSLSLSTQRSLLGSHFNNFLVLFQTFTFTDHIHQVSGNVVG